MDKKRFKFSKYGISSKRYKELCGFCEQYPDWKQAIKDYTFISGIQYSDMPKGSFNTKSPVESAAIKLEKYISNVDLIERVAKEADKEFWQFIIDSACYEVPVQYLIGVKNMALSKSAFYDRRRFFFYLLDREKNMQN